MGLYDELRCHHPLPAPNAQELLYQTKDTPAQWCEQYEIRADGTLHHQAYDVEDRSDKSAEGLAALIGCMTRVNERWESCDMTGEVRFYEGGGYDEFEGGWWLEFSAYFIAGKLQSVTLIEDTRPLPDRSNRVAADESGGAR